MGRVRGLSVAAAAVLLAAGALPALTRGAVAAPGLGSDISFPQCGQAYPTTPAFAIIGVNDGRPFTANPCFVSEYRWAVRSGQVEFYMNTANPGVSQNAAFAYGADSARDAYAYATSHVPAGPGHQWWLDVETANSWSGDQGANTSVIAGALAYLRSQQVNVGIYSTRYQWGLITGGAQIPSVPNWVPGAASQAEAPGFCAARRSFSGGPVVMTQFTSQFDFDYVCPGVPSPPPLPPPSPLLTQLLQNILNWLAGRQH